jgi:hypothetical protein
VSTADTSEPPPALRQALESADSAVGLTGAVDDDDARLASERKSTASARRNAEAAPAAGAVGAAAIDSAAVDNARTTITRKSARLQSVQAAEAAKVKAAVPTPTAAFAPAHNKRVGKKNAAIIVQLEKKGVNSPVSNRTRSRTPATLATSALPPVSATPTLPATALPTAAPPTAPPVSPSVTSTLPATNADRAVNCADRTIDLIIDLAAAMRRVEIYRDWQQRPCCDQARARDAR